MNAQTYTLGPGQLTGAEVTIAMEPNPASGRVRVAGTLFDFTRSMELTAGELSKLRDQIDAALDGLAGDTARRVPYNPPARVLP